jgi:ribosomal protein L11 methyltransferase
MKSWLEVSLKSETNFTSHSEIISALLSELGYEGFVENKDHLIAYIDSSLFSEETLKELASAYDYKYIITEVGSKNWNELAELSLEPIIIGDKVIVSTKTIESNFEYPIIISPEMSFGTGHHETTYMVMEQMLKLNFSSKSVLDAGSGTGILSILADKLGAESVLAYDNDINCYQSINKNIEQNKCENIKAKLGTEESFIGLSFDFIIANITKNILLNLVTSFKSSSKTDTILILSGFYKSDNKDIINTYKSIGFTLISEHTKNDWSCLILKL